MRQRLQALIEENDVTDSVTLEGPAADIGSDMAEASVFVLSSRFEGFPLILLEAMSKGMGVVAFDCPTGPADIVDDHRNGILVPPEDVEALAHGIREIVEDVPRVVGVNVWGGMGNVGSPNNRDTLKRKIYSSVLKWLR